MLRVVLQLFLLCLILSIIHRFIDFYFLTSNNGIRYLTNTNAFIHSAYYFANSRTFGRDAVVLIVTINQNTVSDLQNDFDGKISIVATNYSMTRWIRPLKIQISKPDDPCDYTTVIMSTNVMRNMSRLEIQGSLTLWSDSTTSEIKFLKPVRNVKNPVVFCVNPIIAGEDSQVLSAQVMSARKYGAHLHIYVISAVEEFYKVLRKLESLNDNVSLSPWPSIQFPQTYNVIGSRYWTHFEFRTQTAASTDCLIRYKEAAQFIANLDIEDIFEPKTGLGGYYEEFENVMRGFDGLYLRNGDFHVVRPDFYNITRSYWNSHGRFVAKYIGDENNESTYEIKRITQYPLKISNYTQYSRILSKCLERMRKSHKEVCPNISLCKFTKNDAILCIHSDARYRSGVRMTPITFHFNQEPYFNRNYRCFF